MEPTNQEKRFNQRIRELRREKHAAGYPFMINDTTLDKDLVYYEYPDGRISIERLIIDGENSRFELVRWITSEETEAVKLKHGISD